MWHNGGGGGGGGGCMYSNIRRGAIQIYIPLQKYVLQETLVNIIGDTHEFFYL